MKRWNHFWVSVAAVVALAVAVGFAASPAQRSTESRTSHPGFLVLDDLKKLSLLESRVLRGESLTREEKATLEQLSAAHDARRGRGGTLDNVGGPDDSGYVFIDNQGGDTATYSWIELRGDSLATWINEWEWEGRDDAMAVDSVAIGFEFPFYGETYTHFNVCTNGHIQFTTRSPQFWDLCLPVEFMGPAILFFGDDLHLDYGGIPDGMDVVGYRNFGTHFVIEFDSVGNCCEDGSSYKFEAILYPDGRIKLQYNNLVFGEWWEESQTIGIQQSAEGSYLQYVCDSVGHQPIAGLAVWFMRPSGVPSRVTDLQGMANGTTVSLAWYDPVTDTYGHPVVVDSVRIERDGQRAGVVAAGVQGFSQGGVPIGSHEYAVRAFHGRFGSAAARVTVAVGSASYGESFDVTNGSWVAITGWEWGPPSNAAPHSPPNVWGNRLSGEYLDLACDEARLAPGLAVASADASVEFYCWYSTESWFDGVNFQASADGGNTWQVLIPSVHPYDLEAAFNDCLGDSIPCWSGMTLDWVRVVIPIGQFVGQTPIFRFVLGSDGSVTYPGFLFDDFRIWGLAVPVGVPVSGTITLDGGAGSLTQVVVRADGLGGPTASPNIGGAYTLQNVQTGQRTLTAELLRYAPALRSVLVPAGGIGGQNITLRRLPPPAPSGLAATQDGTGQIVALQWTASVDPLVDQYRVNRKRRFDTAWTVVRTVTAVQATDTLPSSNAWQYSVSAVDTNVIPPAIESSRSLAVQVLYGAVPPSNLAAQTNFDDRIRLRWSAPGEGFASLLQPDDGEAPLSGRGASTLDDPNYYIVYRDSVDLAHPLTASYDNMVAEGIAYTYYVTAHYPDGSESEPTNSVTATAAMPPDAPQDLTGQPLDAAHIRLSWVDPTVNENGTACTDLAAVRVYRNGVQLATVPAAVQQYDDTPPYPNRFTVWSVRALDEVPNEGPADTFMGSVIDQWLDTSYVWIDISTTGIPVVNCDNCIEGPFPIGFPFPFYGNTYDSVRVASTGFITFMNTWASMGNEAIPSPWEPNNAIYAFWDDLSPWEGGQVLYHSDPANSVFVVSFLGVAHFGMPGNETFQIVLRPDGSVRLSYQTVESNTSCTAGVENADGTMGVMVWNNGAVQGMDWTMASQSTVDFWGSPPRYGDVSGHVTLDGGSGNVTQAVLRANGASHPSTNPDANGDYTLRDVVVGNRILTATLTGYHQDTLQVVLPDTFGLTNRNFTLRRLNPPAPTGLTATLNSATGRDSLHWDVSPDPLVDQYRLYRKMRDSVTWVLNRTVGPRDHSWAIDTLTVDGIYQYRVTAVDTNVTPPPVESGPSVSVQVIFGEVPPERLAANGHFDNKIRLSWLPPGVSPAVEVFYDSAEVDSTCVADGLGFNGQFPFAWFVAHYQGIGQVRIERIRTRHYPWSLPGAPVQLGVFDDAGDGTPTFMPLGVTDTVVTDPTTWLDVTLPTPVVIPGGSFFVGIRQVTAQRVDIGMDFCAAPQFNTFFATTDTTVPWMALEESGFSQVLVIRATVVGNMGEGLMELSPTPVERARPVVSAAQAQPEAKSSARVKRGDGRQTTVSGIPLPLSASVSSPQASSKVTDESARSFSRRAVVRQPAVNGARGRRTLDDVLRYRIYRDGLYYDSVTVALTSWENTGLIENQLHSYYVTAVYDNSEASAPSNTVSAACNMAPAAPANLSLTAVGSRQMRLQWTDPTLNADGAPCVDLAGIRVYRDGAQIGTVAAGTGQYTDTPPDPMTFYVWEVRGCDEVPNEGPGISQRSAVQSPWRVVDYEWLDVWNQSTPAVQCDDCAEGPIDLGFTFTFYGQTYSSVYISSNGLLCFLDGQVWGGGPIPSPWEPNGAVYMFATDLLPTGGECRYYSDPVHERFVVTYQDCPHWGNPALETFQVILEAEDGIRLNYQLVSDPTWCLIGVENADGTDAFQLYWDGGGDFTPTSLSAVQFWGGPSSTLIGTVWAFGSNLPISDAQVWATGWPDTAVTDTAGAYELPIEAGTYTVNFHHPMYCDASVPNVVVVPGEQTVRNGVLRSPQAQFSVTSLNISTPYGVNAQTTFTLSNNGGQCPLSFSISDTSDWLSASPASGEVPRNQSVAITVSAVVQGIPAGSERSSALVIEYNAAGSPHAIPVDLFVGLEAGDVAAQLPTEFAYHPNYPNPFNATTTIVFDVPRESEVRIIVYNLAGQEVAAAVTGVWAAGRHRMTFDGGRLPSGMYLVRMSAGDFQAVGKMLLLK